MTSKTDVSSIDESPRMIAAIDMGSNSFHMIVARVVQGEIMPIDKLGEKVQLAAGLDHKGNLSDTAQERALDCLRRFSQRLGGIAPSDIQAIGTNALRVARNKRRFIREAEKILGAPVDVISGREEARLIYLGVSHTLSDDEGRRLVMDIGGGSTEFIIGERFEPKELESLHMGCVSFRDRYFPNGMITREAMIFAITHASREMLSIQRQFQQLGWEQSVGSSGSIKAIAGVCQNLGLTNDGITAEALNELCERIIEIGQTDKLLSIGVTAPRCSVFPAGLAILMAAFSVLKIREMNYTDGALREGVLYDILGRISHEDVRERTISALQHRYHVDQDHAAAVEATAITLLNDVRESWNLQRQFHGELLRWACRIHEAGLAIAHSQYHKHGAYLVRFSDLSGFSRQSQLALSILVRSHRRKINKEVFEEVETESQTTLRRLAILLRLAVLFQRARLGTQPEGLHLYARKKNVTVELDESWLRDHPLTRADLEAEADYLDRAGYSLGILARS